MKWIQAMRLLTPVALVLLSGCAAATNGEVESDESVELQTNETSSELVSGNVDMIAPAPPVTNVTPAGATITSSVTLKALAPGATATLTYSLGRQAFRHAYYSQTEVRTVVLRAGMTEITDTVSTPCSSTRLPYTWFITGTLTTSAGSFAVQGERRGARCD